MSKTETSQLQKADTKTTIPFSKGKGTLMFFPAKGLGSYHAFGATEEKSRKLFRSAVLQYGSLVGLPNADQALASVLPKTFTEEASARGWTLKEAMQEAQAYYATHAPEGKPQRESLAPNLIIPKLHCAQPNKTPLAHGSPRPLVRFTISHEKVPAWESLSQFPAPCGRTDYWSRRFWRDQPWIFRTLLGHYCPDDDGIVRIVSDPLSLYIHLEMPFARFSIRLSTHRMSQKFRSRADRVPVSGVDLAARTGTITFGELMQEAVRFFDAVRPDIAKPEQQN